MHLFVGPYWGETSSAACRAVARKRQEKNYGALKHQEWPGVKWGFPDMGISRNGFFISWKILVKFG